MIWLALANSVSGSGVDSGLLGGLVGAAGGVGFAIWYGYYTTSTLIPKLVSDFREERKLDREEMNSFRHEFSEAVGDLSKAVRSLPCREKTSQ